MVVTTPPFIYQSGTYEVKVVLEPEGKYKCYGIENRQTGVVEAYISQLARAMQIADQFEEDLKVGFKTTSEASVFEAALMSALQGSKKVSGGGGVERMTNFIVGFCVGYTVVDLFIIKLLLR